MSPAIRVDGIDTHVAETGTGPAVLLLHGAALGASTATWEPLLGPLSEHGFRAITFDQPGFGLSAAPPDASGGYARTFVLKLMDALEVDRAHLVGHSMTGGVCVRLGFDHPDRVRSVAAVGTGSLLPPLPDGKGGGPPEAATAEPTVEESRKALSQTLYDQSILTDELVRRWNAMSTGKNFQAYLERTRAKGEGKEALWERLDQLPVPLLLVYGNQDRGSVAERSVLARERFPNINLHMLDQCKHMVPWDRPDETVRLLGEFLTSAEREASISRA